ncbi:MAG: hypothetical protein HRT74_01655 [Flavobacteriales bacterium]|nr:hypothetical protein [Flavobacteriales bacterium]
MKQRNALVVLFFGFAIAMVSCLPDSSFPPEPKISFKSFTVSDGDAVLSIDFTDGDGDIGLNQGDTTGINCPDTCRFYYNLFCEYYELQNGEWVHIELDPELGEIPFYYRVPFATPSGQNPALDGTIDIDMPNYFLFGTGFDTARFEVQLVDRSLNESNKVVTSSFIKP